MNIIDIFQGHGNRPTWLNNVKKKKKKFIHPLSFAILFISSNWGHNVTLRRAHKH